MTCTCAVVRVPLSKRCSSKHINQRVIACLAWHSLTRHCAMLCRKGACTRGECLGQPIYHSAESTKLNYPNLGKCAASLQEKLQTFLIQEECLQVGHFLGLLHTFQVRAVAFCTDTTCVSRALLSGLQLQYRRNHFLLYYRIQNRICDERTMKHRRACAAHDFQKPTHGAPVTK